MKLPPFDSTRRSSLQRIRDEFHACSEGSGTAARITPEGLARHWHNMAEAEHRRAGHGTLGPGENQVVALRVAQLVQEMDLCGTGRIRMEEWVHYMLLQQARIPALRTHSQIHLLLRAAVQHYPRLLEDLQRMFWAADVASEGFLVLKDVTEMYRRRLWHFSPTTPRGLLSEADFMRMDPQDLALEVVRAMDLDGTDAISYAEFMAYCLGRRKHQVTLHLYDITKGAAAVLAPWLLGRQLDGLWHTGVEVYGKEYYFGGEIFFDTPAETAFGEPMRRIPLGFTLWRQEELHNFIVDELRPVFNRDAYDVVLNNCNHFADRICVWLTGRHIPSEVVQQPESLMQLPAARLFRPILNCWLGSAEPNEAAPAKAFNHPSMTHSKSWSSLTKRLMMPGVIVLIHSSEGDDLGILGTVTTAPSSACGKEGQDDQGSCWVRYLKVIPCSADRISEVVLCTERFPFELITVAKMDDVCREGAYLTALRSLISPAVLCLMTRVTDSVYRCNGGASSGLKPMISQPPGSMFSDESPTASPMSTPRMLEGIEAERMEIFKALDDLPVPLEARICMDSSTPLCRRRGCSVSEDRHAPQELDLHRRNKSRGPRGDRLHCETSQLVLTAL